MEDFDVKLGSLLVEAREQAFLYQDAVAELMGISPTLLHRHETGKSPLYVKRFLKYCSIVGTTPESILQEMAEFEEIEEEDGSQE